MMVRRLLVAGIAVLIALTTACASSSARESGPLTLRLGYFPNLTHAPAIYGVDKGIFASNLGPNVTLKTSIFNAGPSAVEAIFADSIDATFVGPNPAINAFQRSRGEAVRIVAGATLGGAALVVQPGITSDLKGKTIATPQLGNTQDVALRSWLKGQGLAADTAGGGAVHILPQENSQTIDTFKQKRIDGAWVPEPFASRLVVEGSGKILVDEATLWPAGKYATTVLIVRTAFLKEHPDVVRNLIKGEVAAIDVLNANAAAASVAVNDGIKALTGTSLQHDTLAAAWARLTFSIEPPIASIRTVAGNAFALGLLKSADLEGIEDVTLLNDVLKSAGRPVVSGG